MTTASRSLRLFGCAALLLLSAPSWAANTAVQDHLKRASKAFEDFNDEGALKSIQKAKQSARSTEDFALIALYEGIVLADLGRDGQALAAFQLHLTSNPKAKLPFEVSPKVEALFERARAKVLANAAPLATPPANPPPVAVVPLAPPPPRPTSVEEAATKVASDGAQPTRWRQYAWLPAVGAVVAGGGACVLLLTAPNDEDALFRGSVEEARATLDRERLQRGIGYSLLGISAAGLITAATMYLLQAPERPKAALVPTNSGLVLSLSGQF